MILFLLVIMSCAPLSRSYTVDNEPGLGGCFVAHYKYDHFKDTEVREDNYFLFTSDTIFLNEHYYEVGVLEFCRMGCMSFITKNNRLIFELDEVYGDRILVYLITYQKKRRSLTHDKTLLWYTYSDVKQLKLKQDE